nr:hypothetical protein [Candidatus Njordarchaeum guaymaensis]
MIPTPAAQQALAILRDASKFQWYVIPIFLLVLLAYSNEIERRKWNIVLGAAAFWGMDLFNEIWNALVFHFTDYAAVWMTPGNTAYLIFIGLNIEITMMFAIMGLFVLKILPENKKMKIFGKIPNRWFFAVFNSILSVIVEIVLNAAGALVWEYPWWNVWAPWLIFLIGYLPFNVVAFWVYDAKTMKKKFTILGTVLAVDLICIAIFVPLGWI